MKEINIFILSRSFLLRIRNVSDKRCRGNYNTHFVFCNSFLNSSRLRDNKEKYCRGGQVTEDNMTHAYCMLDE